VSVTITTRHYGEIEIDERQIFEFPEGILGFDYVKRFAIFDSHDGKSPFKWMQAVEEPELAFVVIAPVEVFGEYELKIAEQDMEEIGAQKPDDLVVFAIVTIPDDPKNMTVNLQGPIIINPDTGRGRQVISLSDRYSVRHRVMDEIGGNAREEG
jgi:flagellar assembly factor FliW